MWILRIEDIDTGRSRREYAEQIMDDLQWLGLTWDEGPFYQSERGGIYQQHLNMLKEQGLLYPCYCTRADIMATQAPHESDGRVVYKGTCRPTNTLKPNTEGKDFEKKSYDGNGIEGKDIAGKEEVKAGGRSSTRIIVPNRAISFTDIHYGPQTVNLASHCGDFVVRRADGAWAYQLAVVVDDALMGITEVVRGRDLLLSAAQQIYLYEQLGYTAPNFCHLPLLCNTAGQRLSKRDRSLDMGSMRSESSASQIIGQLAYYAGIIDRPDPVMPQELTGCFSWDKVPIKDIVVG